MEKNVMKTIVAVICFGLLIAFSDGATRKKEDRPNKLSLEFKRRRKAFHPRTSPDTVTASNPWFSSFLTNQNATSNDDVIFKCKVEGNLRSNIKYKWYKDGFMIDSGYDRRFSITPRPWGSRLRIKSLYTLDAGAYKCEANDGRTKVHKTVRLFVKFELPPPIDVNEPVKIPSGKCEVYRGEVCAEQFKGKKIFLDGFQDQQDMEKKINEALKLFATSRTVSKKCQKYAIPAFCHFVFPQCTEQPEHQTTSGERLCREDCEILQSDICLAEYLQSKSNPLLKTLFETANCSNLPSLLDSKCSTIGLPSSNSDCYHGNGIDYRGTTNVAVSELPCMPWPETMVEKHPELIGGHNYCRNPGKIMDKPWCYVDRANLAREPCNIELCQSDIYKDLTVVFLLYISVLVMFLFFFGFAILHCIRWRRNFQTVSRRPDEKIKLMEVDEKSLLTLVELGTWKSGKVYQGTIVDDSRFGSKQPFAFKFVDRLVARSHFNGFKREIEILSKLSHPRIAQLKAFCNGPKVSCFIFDHSIHGNLHECLLFNGPTPNMLIKREMSGLEKSSVLTDDLLLAMALQISTGLEYLSSKNFIHRDLAARNILVCENGELKICNLEVIRDSDISNYYKNKQEELLPIRWMSPESIQNWKFSDKSTVWSFGVLLWEMFSYGLQPYCGFGNHEVLEMISRRQLLPYPDQCPAKIYSLMQECWKARPETRPNFSKLTKNLNEIRRLSTMKIVYGISLTGKQEQNLRYVSDAKESILSEDAIISNQSTSLL